MPEFEVDILFKIVDQISSSASSINSSLSSINKGVKDTASNTSALQQAISTAAGVMMRDLVQGSFSAVTKASGAASEAFQDYELTLTKTASASGVVGAEAKQLQSELAKLAESQTKLGYSGREASEALEALVKAGMSSSEAADALEASLSLARLESISTDQAAGYLVQTLTQFHLKATDAGDALNLISKAADAGIGAASDYASGLSNAGAAAANMGISLDETLASLVVLDKTFGSATESGTYLNAMFKDLIAKSDDLGLNLYNADGSMKSLDQIVQQLKSNVAAFGDDQQAVNEYLSTFDVRAQRAVIGLINYDGNINDVVDQMGEQLDVQDKVNSVMDTTAGKLSELKAREENASYALGEMTSGITVMWKEFAVSLGPIGSVIDALGPTMLQAAFNGVTIVAANMIAKFIGKGGVTDSLGSVGGSVDGLSGKLGGLNSISFGTLLGSIAAIGFAVVSVQSALSQLEMAKDVYEAQHGTEMSTGQKVVEGVKGFFNAPADIGVNFIADALDIEKPTAQQQALLNWYQAGKLSVDETKAFIKSGDYEGGILLGRYRAGEMSLAEFTQAETKHTLELAKTIKGYASGFEGVVSEPTLMLAGEAGPERVSIRPGLGGESERVSSQVIVSQQIINIFNPASTVDVTKGVNEGMSESLRRGTY